MRLVHYIKRLLRLQVLLLILPGCLKAAEVTLAWDANIEPSLAGYRLHYGKTSRAYSHSVDVGNVTTYTLTGLDPGALYYFAATAYDAQGNESGFSDEISYTIPGAGADPAPATDGQISFIKIEDPAIIGQANNAVRLPDGNILYILPGAGAGDVIIWSR